MSGNKFAGFHDSYDIYPMMVSKVLLLVFLNSILFSAISQNPERNTDENNSTASDLTFLEIFPDSSNSLDLGLIKSDKYLRQFVPLSDFREEISNNNTYWIHLKITNLVARGNNRGLFVPLENHIVDVYTVTDSFVVAQRTGFFVNSNENDEIIPLSNILKINATGDVDLFMKIKNINDELPNFNIKPTDTEKAYLKNKRKITIDAIVQGMIWLMLLYGIFLYVLHRDKLYLYYSLYSLCLSLWLMGTWGFYYQFLNSLPRGLYTYQSIPGFFGIIFYIQFIRTFIASKLVFPKWDKILIVVQIVALVEIARISVFVPVTNLVMINYYLQASVSMILEIFLMIFIIKVLITQVQFKYIIGIGSSILIMCNFAGALLWVIYNDNTWFIFQKAGSVLELMIFNFGLSYRYLVIEKKEQKLQKKLILQLNKNTELQKKVNRELEQKVLERTVEIRDKNQILEKQKNEIEYQKNNLTASIQYAERIQSALLTSTEILTSKFPESFILFKPLDIVSGDFYWFKASDNLLYVVAADCTGHGVPGAFMSILGVSQLNDISSLDTSITADKILNHLRDNVIRALHQSDEKSRTKDGMEVAVCIIDPVKRILQYSGAFRPLFLIRESELKEFKGNSMPVGIYEDNLLPFSRQDIPYNDGDQIYLSSDGYCDQLGGPERKTFKSENFKKLLLKIHKLPFGEQRDYLIRQHEEWKGESDQTDDILVIGIKL